LLLALLAPLVGCASESWEDQAIQATQMGDYTLAADFYTRAAIEAGCPARARLLIRRAEVQELDGIGASAMESIDKAISNCPDHTEAWWMRAQRAAEAGDRERAMADAAEIQAVHPEAAALYAELAMEEQLERSIRDRTQALVSTLKDSLDLEAKDVKLRGRNRETLARQVPVPMTLSYQVRQSVQSPQKFELQWEEMWSYRGDAADDGYVLVRRLDLPPLDHGMPLYFRLSMSNQRQAMRFVVSPRGEIVDSTWLRNGPNRGMRPEMLAPEVEGTLRRRRLFDPGESGERGPGDTWRGEDVRIVDGKPVAVEFTSRAVAWEETLGVRTLRVRTQLTAEGYSCDEEHWLHVATAVPVRWTRTVKYAVQTPSGPDAWQESLQGALVSISGIE